MKIINKLFFSSALLAFSLSVCAEVVVVVHPSVRDNSINQDDVAKLFLGKISKLPSGHKVIAIDQEEDSQTRNIFYEEVTGKNQSQLTAYWARLVFSGKGQPPKTVMEDDEVKELVANNPSIIGYMDKSLVDTSVKVVFIIK